MSIAGIKNRKVGKKGDEICFILLFLMRRKVSTAIRFRDNVYECDDIPTPFVMGFVRPKICISFRLAGEEREYIIRHERYILTEKISHKADQRNKW